MQRKEGNALKLAQTQLSLRPVREHNACAAEGAVCEIKATWRKSLPRDYTEE